MHFHYKVATTLSLLILISFVFQLIAVLSVPVTSTISLCTYDGYKFGVFGLCSTTTHTCSPIEIGYSKTTVELLKGFSLPSNTRHSISNLLIVHPISTGFTFILLIMSLLSHFKVFNRSLRFLFCLMLWCFITFLLCLLSFLVDILLFVPHLDWAGWIVLAATVLVAIGGTVSCIMRRTASSRNLYDFKKQNENNNVEMYSMLPLKESYGYIRDNDGTNLSETISDSEKEDSDQDLTNQNLLYDDDISTHPTDVVSSLQYRGYQGIFNNNNNNNNNNHTSHTAHVIDEDDDEGYYNYNPMSNNYAERNSRTNRNSIISQPPPGRSVLPYPAVEPDFEEPTVNNNLSESAAAAAVVPYPTTDIADVESNAESPTLDSNNTGQNFLTPTIPRIDTPPMDEDTYEPQPVNITPLRGPRPLPGGDDLPAVPDKIPLEEDDFVFQNSGNVTDAPLKQLSFKKPVNINHTQTSFSTTTNSTLAHNNLSSIVGKNHGRFISNSSAPTSSFYGDESELGESVDVRSGVLQIDELDESHDEDEIPSSEYLDLNEENLSSYSNVQSKSILKKLSTDSIASSNFTSISQRPVNPKYYETSQGSKRRSFIQPNPVLHPFRAQLGARPLTREEKLKDMRKKLSTGEF